MGRLRPFGAFCPALDLAFCLALAFACFSDAKAGEEVVVSPERQGELKHILLQDCGSCHGLTLKGGLGSPLTPQRLEGMDRQYIAHVILDGIQNTAMPPWRGLLNEDEALWIADALLHGDMVKGQQ